MMKKHNYVIVRTYSAGVFAGDGGGYGDGTGDDTGGG